MQCQDGGRMKMKRTKNTVVVTEENAGYTIAEPDSDLLFILDNPYVKNVHQQKIFYTKDFYIAMYKLIHDQKKTYVEAYEALGFDVSRLGRSRAEQAGKNAMERAKNNRLFTVDPSNYDGSIPLSDMPDLAPEEERAYMKARILYLESLMATQNKIQSFLEENSISSKRNP